MDNYLHYLSHIGKNCCTSDNYYTYIWWHILNSEVWFPQTLKNKIQQYQQSPPLGSIIHTVMPKIKSHAFNFVLLGITRDQHMPSWRCLLRHFLIQQHLNAITQHGSSLTLPMKSQDALPELQPLIRHGLISERRCQRERGGRCTCSEAGAGPEVKTQYSMWSLKQTH